MLYVSLVVDWMYPSVIRSPRGPVLLLHPQYTSLDRSDINADEYN